MLIHPVMPEDPRPILEILGDLFGGDLANPAYRRDLEVFSKSKEPPDPRVTWEVVRRQESLGITYSELAHALRVKFAVSAGTWLHPSEFDPNTPPVVAKEHEWRRLCFNFAFGNGIHRVAIANANSGTRHLTSIDFDNIGDDCEEVAAPLFIVARNIFEDPRRWMRGCLHAANAVPFGAGGVFANLSYLVAQLAQLTGIVGSHTVVRSLAGHIRREALANTPLTLPRIDAYVTALAAAASLVRPRSQALIDFAQGLVHVFAGADDWNNLIEYCRKEIQEMNTRDLSVSLAISELMRGGERIGFYCQSEGVYRALCVHERPRDAAVLIRPQNSDTDFQRRMFQKHHSPYPRWVRIVRFPHGPADMSATGIRKLVIVPFKAYANCMVADAGADHLVAICRSTGIEIHAILSEEKYSPEVVNVHRLGVDGRLFSTVEVLPLSGYWIVR